MSDMLNIAAGALDAYQQDLGLISNNIANVGSNGFKSQAMQFQDLYYTPVTAPTAPTQTTGGIDGIQDGLGVKISSTDTDFGQGTLQTTGNATNLALDGDGYFILNSTNGGGSPTYTRNGDFTINQNGTLIDPSTGLAVQGYTANSAGVLAAAGGTPTPISIPIGLSTTAVGTGFGTKTGPSISDQVFDVMQGGNLNQSSWQSVAAGGSPVTQTSTTTIYDSLGASHLATFTYSPVLTGAGALPASVNNPNGTAVTPATAWQVSVQFADGTAINGGAANAAATIGEVYFDANGQYINTTGSGTGGAGTPVHLIGTAASTANGNELNITNWGVGQNATKPTASAAAPPSTGPIAIGFNNMTSLSGTGEAVTTVSQNGYAQGTLNNVAIGQDGTVTGAYSNGLQKTIARVAVATFENEQGLERVGNSQFVQTSASGLAQIGTASQGRFGSIISNSLEESNVSVSDQFTKLIIAQNAYVANSKSISISKEDFQDISQLIP